jgi:CRISPR/Cas system-associated exonuclease Cas4 (RecB family)
VARIFVAGSAARRLDAAREFLLAQPPATEVLVVSENRGAADDLVRSIAAKQPATFGFHRFSLTQLAYRIAAGELARRELTPVTPLAAQATAAHVTHALTSRGELPYFAPVAAYPGFAPSLTSTLSELRLAGVSGASIDGDIGRLLATYDDEFDANHFSDAALLFAIATEIVKRDAPSLARSPLLLLDVRAPSKSHPDFLRALVAASSESLATIHSADEETLAQFTDADVLRPDEHAPRTSLERLRTNLFSPDTLQREEFDDSVVFFSAPGEGREAVEIARAIVRHARSGIALDDMAVFLRASSKYQAHLEAAFERANIPAYFARGSRRPHPSGRAILTLLACAAEGLSAKRFAEYLSLGQVPSEASADTWRPPEEQTFIDELLLIDEPPIPSAPATNDDAAQYDGNLREPYRWEELLVEAAVIGGKDRWQRRLAGLGEELRRRVAELTSEEPESSRIDILQQQLARLGHLREFALPIIGRLDALQQCSSWKDWIHALRELAAAALRQPDRVLEMLTELEPMAAIAPVRIDEVRITLAERLSSLETRPPKRRFGRVFVTRVDEAAGRSFKVVFIPGLVERGFPQKVREDPLLLDEQRKAISPDLELLAGRAHDERLRLHLATGAAEQFLYVSYPRIDAAQGRSRVASFYAVDVIRAGTGRIPDHEELERSANRAVGARLAWPAPVDAAHAIDDLEHDLAILAPRLQKRDPAEQAGRARYLLNLNPYLRQSLGSRYMRWERHAWNHFDGITRKSPGIADALDASSLKARPYSASMLQRYAACPHQFFLSAIVRLAPREIPQPPVRLDPLTRGLMIHAIHATTLRRLKSAGLLPLVTERIDEAEAILHRIVDETAATWSEDLAPAIPRVFRDEVAMIRTDLRLWLRDIASEPERWIAERCEFAFGLPHDPGYDEGSVREPARLPGDWLLRGSVDLIERRAVFGDYRVIDYKTGSNRTKDDLVIGGGETLQPLLYALAVEAVLGASVSVSRLFFSTSKGGFAKNDVDITERSQLLIQNVLTDIDTAITSGFLPPAPRLKTRAWSACEYCDFLSVCGPYEPERAQRKDAGPIARLEDLRTEK